MLDKPKGFKYWEYDEETGEYKIEKAPEWAIKEFAEFFELVSDEPDENGIVTLY